MFVFLVSAGSSTGVPVLCFSYSHFLVDAGCNVGNIASCDFDVGDVDVAELEEMR